MIATPVIQVRLASKPPTIELGRGVGVEDDFWHALPLRLGALPSRDGGTVLRVPVERFLAARLWLRDHCLSYQVGLELDDRVRYLLRRAQDENRVVRQRLEQPHTILDASVAAASLNGAESRFNRSLREFQLRDLAKLLDL